MKYCLFSLFDPFLNSSLRLVTLEAEYTIYSFYITCCWLQMCLNLKFVFLRIPFKAIQSWALTDNGKILMNLLRYMMKLLWQFWVVDMHEAHAAPLRACQEQTRMHYVSLKQHRGCRPSTAGCLQRFEIIAAFIFGALIMNLCTFKSLSLN